VTARKDDQGKPRPSLVPAEEFLDLAQLFQFGATKYTPDNWREGEGLKWSRMFDALERHSWAFWSGEDYDAESGAAHMIAVAFSALILAHYMKHFPENDDRWKGRTDAA
jgi:mannose/cellobiose epimerase-like protein (N-acyl-D-glucosamine 2-epimerase family)